MSELEQRLTNELGKLAEQYGQDQKRLAGQCASLAGQVTRLEEQVRQLAGQYARDRKRWDEQVEKLTENMMLLGGHVTVLTNAYESANDSHNALVKDLDELFR